MVVLEHVQSAQHNANENVFEHRDRKCRPRFSVVVLELQYDYSVMNVTV
jgi:hypothetical protein